MSQFSDVSEELSIKQSTDSIDFAKQLVFQFDFDDLNMNIYKFKDIYAMNDQGLLFYPHVSTNHCFSLHSYNLLGISDKMSVIGFNKLYIASMKLDILLVFCFDETDANQFSILLFSLIISNSSDTNNNIISSCQGDDLKSNLNSELSLGECHQVIKVDYRPLDSSIIEIDSVIYLHVTGNDKNLHIYEIAYDLTSRSLNLLRSMNRTRMKEFLESQLFIKKTAAMPTRVLSYALNSNYYYAVGFENGLFHCCSAESTNKVNIQYGSKSSHLQVISTNYILFDSTISSILWFSESLDVCRMLVGAMSGSISLVTIANQNVDLNIDRNGRKNNDNGMNASMRTNKCTLLYNDTSHDTLQCLALGNSSHAYKNIIIGYYDGTVSILSPANDVINSNDRPVYSLIYSVKVSSNPVYGVSYAYCYVRINGIDKIGDSSLDDANDEMKDSSQSQIQKFHDVLVLTSTSLLVFEMQIAQDELFG